MTFEDRALVDRFLDMMAAEAGASRNTLAAYRTDLERTAEALGGTLGSADSDALSSLGGKWSDLAPSTVARRSAALRRFFGFLVEEGIRKDDPSAALPRPALERPLPKILDSDEVSALFEAAEARAVERRALGLPQPRACSSCSTDRAFARRSWSAFREALCASASLS